MDTYKILVFEKPNRNGFSIKSTQNIEESLSSTLNNVVIKNVYSDILGIKNINTREVLHEGNFYRRRQFN